MKKLNSKQQKIVDKLFANLDCVFWSKKFVRLPQNRTISKLLNELGINNSSQVREYEKWNKPAGFVYSTYGGQRTYTNHRLRVHSVGLDLNSENRHPCYQSRHASKIIALIHCHGFDLGNEITDDCKHRDIVDAISLFKKSNNTGEIS
tara:strand:- start:569 stop:1012 length:444 start_codon:yes stop_codon:yes gene_type:complete